VIGLGLASLDGVYEMQGHIKFWRWRTATVSPSYRGPSETREPPLTERISEESRGELTSFLYTVIFSIRGGLQREVVT